MIAGHFAAMGTTVSVTAADDGGVAATRRWFERAEQQLSRFLPHSALSQLNDDSRTDLLLPPTLAEIFLAADEVRRLTQGLVDIAVGGEVIRWGYDRTFAAVVDRDEAPTAFALADWELNGARLRRSPGTRFDLGGVAKGWAADRALESGLADIVSAGGDIASRHPECEVLVDGPDGELVASVALGVGALATSSTARRRWRVAGRPAHHIIDPRTGAPAHSPVVTATAVTHRVVLAEAAAKAILILGASGLAWAARQDWVRSALVVWSDGSVYATKGLELAA